LALVGQQGHLGVYQAFLELLLAEAVLALVEVLMDLLAVVVQILMVA
jgi:hypothetical protein